MSNPRIVAVLFARSDSIYKTLPWCEVWDAERDARTWPGGMPIVGHPPCGQWGQLRHFANDVPEVKALAPWCVEAIRREGGILEHPEASALWPHCGMPAPDFWNTRDAFGGYSLAIEQFDFGHLAQKKTRLYIVGCEPADLPPMPIRFDIISHAIGKATKNGPRSRPHLPRVSKADREHTPRALAEWMLAVARRCRVPVPA